MAAIVFGQFLLGLTTLLLGVPVWAGALHQAGAVLLLSIVLIVAHRLQAQN
jgi:cytochrome c oxidase assembly protein subunit 15